MAVSQRTHKPDLYAALDGSWKIAMYEYIHVYEMLIL